MNYRTTTELGRATESLAYHLQRIIQWKFHMGKQLFSVQVLGWHSPTNAIQSMNPESHSFPQYSKASVTSEFSLLAEYLLIPASFEQPAHYLYIWQRKLGQTFQSDSSLERDRGNQLKERGKYLVPLLLCGLEEPSHAPLYGIAAVQSACTKKAKLLQITLLTLPRQMTKIKPKMWIQAQMCLPTVFTSSEAGT